MKTSLHSRLSPVTLAAVAAACLAVHSARAVVLFNDGFNYATGGLNASDVSPAGASGNAWSSGSSHITVVSGNLTYSGLQDLGGNEIQDVWGVSAGSVVNTYTAQTSGSIFYSFLLNVTTAPTSASTYLTALNPGTGAPNGSSDALQVDMGTAAGGYVIGLRTAGASVTSDSTVLSLDTTYLVVAEYTFGGLGSASLYLDPVAGAAQPTAAVTLAGNGTVTSIADVGFKAQSSATGTSLIDNLIIGTTWADVTPTASPEPSTFALAGLGLLVAAGVRRLRR